MQYVSTISQLCQGHLYHTAQDYAITYIFTDSRKIHSDYAANTLFVALKTARNDGHLFIREAYSKGVRAFLVGNTIGFEDYPEACFIKVHNCVEALQLLAEAIRKQQHIPVIGITGSNGKTMVKEWLVQLLEKKFAIVYNPKSYNSQIGVPLSVWKMEQQHQLGIFEAGISLPGEMEKLEKMIRPTIGLFTNIGEAHAQGFLNNRQKINEKLQLFKHVKQLVYNKDYYEVHECICAFVHRLQNEHIATIQTFTWSYKPDADLYITQVEKGFHQTHIQARYLDKIISIQIPFSDAASIENAIHCWSLMLLLGIDQHVIESEMKELKPVSMRLELIQGSDACVIINDSYNADKRSLSIALEMLLQHKESKKTTLFLSDMQQTGRSDTALYSDVAALIETNKINRLFAIGKGLMGQQYYFKNIPNLEAHFFESTTQFIQNMNGFSFENEAILLKGARSFEFEKILLLLEQHIHQTQLTVSLSAIKNNFSVFKALVKKEIKIMAMVKASSYGNGGSEIARALEQVQVDYLTVAYPDEGVLLRKANINTSIMVMSPSTEAFSRMILWSLEPEIYNMRSLNQFLTVLEKLNKKAYPIHIKLDTGMHRLGFMETELDTLIELLQNNERVKIASLFSHLAAADDKNLESFTHEQAMLFERMSQKICNTLPYKPLMHLCNSAGIVNYPAYHYDMVRLGLGLYGIDNTGQINLQLQQVSTLKTSIAQIKHLNKGESVGYNRKGVLTKEATIATICIGYADGYPRNLSGSGAYVLVNNKPAPIIGTIAMDMCMIDISTIEGVTEGDEVIVFGEALPISQLAQWAGTIAYEIMTNIAPRVKRVFINET